jgi:hypothetical protein
VGDDKLSYDEEYCFWCNKHIGEGNKAYSSLGTDTLQTRRNFCTKEHLMLFKDYMKKQKSDSKPIKPFRGI